MLEPQFGNPWIRRSLKKEIATPLSYSYLVSMDRGLVGYIQSDTTERHTYTHTHTGVEDGMMMLILLTSISKSSTSVTVFLNSLLLKPFHEHACTPKRKISQFCNSGNSALGKRSQCSPYLQVINPFFLPNTPRSKRA